MKTLSYQKPHRLAQLADELYAAFPSWTADVGGRPQAQATIAGDGATLTLTVPDNADTVAVAAVVNAHIPLAVPAPPAAPSPAELAALRDFMAGTNPPSLAAMAAVVRAFIRVYRYRAGRDD
jgi:hypothetical protein